MINIRVAEESDISRILEIEHESISPPWTHGALLREIYNENSFFALAVENDNILGFVILRASEGSGEILQVAVCKNNRRRGAANVLLTAALDYAAFRRIKKVFLEVRESNHAAINLYKKHGFVKVAVRKNYYTQPLENAAVMMKALM